MARNTHTIKLTRHELHSNHTRQQWAENLINVLAKSDFLVAEESRMWLENYGIGKDAQKLRSRRGIKFNEEYEAAEHLNNGNEIPKNSKWGHIVSVGINEVNHNEAAVTRYNTKSLPPTFKSWKELYEFVKEQIERGDMRMGNDIEFLDANKKNKWRYTYLTVIENTLDEIFNEKTEVVSQKKAMDLSVFGMESLVLTALEKFFGSKFHK